jgi:endonuclease/exonuclease/phosphatase family metal-dependent hydrolase
MLSERMNSVDLRDYLPHRRTYPGVFPVLHLDYIYYSGRVEILSVELVRTRLSLVASDHLPLVATVRIR